MTSVITAPSDHAGYRASDSFGADGIGWDHSHPRAAKLTCLDCPSAEVVLEEGYPCPTGLATVPLVVRCRANCPNYSFHFSAREPLCTTGALLLLMPDSSAAITARSAVPSSGPDASST